MATSPLQPIVSAFDLTTVYQDIYTVPADKAGIGIDAVVFSNYTANNVKYSVRLIQSGSPTDLNEIIKDKIIRGNGNDLAQSMIGQALVTGGVIQAKASVNNAININITATVINS